MIGLEFIVKLYNGTYKELAKKLELTPSTVTDWISTRRPIPKAKLEALSKLFKIEEGYFQKTLSEIDKIELQLGFLERKSRKESFEIADAFIDDNGVQQEVFISIDPNENETRMISDELSIERAVLKLRANLIRELDLEQESVPVGGNLLEILQRITIVIDESVPDPLKGKKKVKWEQKHTARIKAMRSMMYFLGVYKKGWETWNDDEDSFHNDLCKVLMKHGLIWEEEKEPAIETEGS